MHKERRDTVMKGLDSSGLEAEAPKATFYVWAGIPEGFGNSKDFCYKVLDACAVWMIPGSMYGDHGEGYFRLALTHPAERLAEAMDRVKKYLS